jgi:hypothetical protein
MSRIHCVSGIHIPKSLGRGLVAGSVAAFVFLVAARAHAQETGVATLKVNREKDPINARLEFRVNQKLVLSTRWGDKKEAQFTPSALGETTFNVKSFNIFGGKTGEYDHKLRIGPGGVAEYVDNGNMTCSFSTVRAGLDVTRLQVALDEKLQEREIASDVVETPAGVKRTHKRSRTIERAVSLTDTEGLEASVKAHFGVLSGEIRGQIARSRMTTYKASETIEDGVEIDGEKLPKARLVWIERTVTGKARVFVDGQERSMPFQFREGVQLRVLPITEPVKQ